MGQFLFILGGLGPLVVGALFTYRRGGQNGLESLVIRSIDPFRASTSTWLIAVFLTPLITFLAVIISGLVAPHSVDLSDLFFAPRPDPGAVTGLAFLILLFGPVSEEIGWRGYGLDALQSRFGPFAASSILAIAWCFWHIPLLFMDGFYDRFGYRPDLILFSWNLILTTFIITWLYNRSNRSIMLVMAYHFMINFVDEMVPGNYLYNQMATALTTVVVLLVIGKWLLDHLSGRAVEDSTG